MPAQSWGILELLKLCDPSRSNTFWRQRLKEGAIKVLYFKIPPPGVVTRDVPRDDKYRFFDYDESCSVIFGKYKFRDFKVKKSWWGRPHQLVVK